MSLDASEESCPSKNCHQHLCTLCSLLHVCTSWCIEVELLYRRRLLDEGLIIEAGHGRVAFTTPGLDDYLREHVVIDGLASTWGDD